MSSFEISENRCDILCNVYSFRSVWMQFTAVDACAGIAQSVQRLATGWTVRGSNPGGGRDVRTRPDGPRGPPSLLYVGYQVFPGSKAAGCVALTTHPHLAPRFKKE